MAEKKSLFDRLKTLFSTNVVVRNVGGKRLRVVDTARYQADGNPHTSKVIDRYGRLHGTRGTPISVYNQYNSFSATKIDLYTDYEAMDTDAIICSALDIYADESTLKNDIGDVLTIRSDNDSIRKILHNLFYDILNVEYNLWPWIRNLCKYGDNYLYLDVKDGLGVTNVVPLSPYEMQRDEGTDPEHIYMTKFIYEGPLGKGEFQNYEVAHFRLLGDTNFLPYGKSMLEGARKLYKQLVLMEDAMLIHRIMRAPEKRVFKIDIGNIPPQEVDNYMQRIINKMKKVPFIDKNSGEYNLKYNMQNLTEDFFLPVRGGDSGTSIENISGLDYAATDDIQYLKNKLFAALKIPKAYLGYDENVNGKATLAAEDVRFARTIERIQRTIISELTKIAIVHLYAQGIQDVEMTNFELSLINPSTIYEQERVNLWSEKVRLATDIAGLNMLSKDWVYENIFKLADGDQERERVKIINDIKDRFRYRSIEDQGNDPAVEPEPQDVEESLEKIKIELKDKGGRPREGNTYGKDKSPFGRDPLGDKENHNALKNRTSEQKALKYINGISAKRKYLHETKGMLDESNILDNQ
jgi:hypothetical protein